MYRGDLDSWALQDRFDTWVERGITSGKAAKTWLVYWNNNISEIKKWTRAGWDGSEANAGEAWDWFDLKFSAGEAFLWAKKYRVKLEDAAKYREFAGGNGQRALNLYQAGYSLSELAFCKKNNIGGLLDGDTNYVGLEPVIDWKRSGFTFEKDIVDWMKKFWVAEANTWKNEKGLSLEDALRAAEEEKKFKAAAEKARVAKESERNEAKTDSEKNLTQLKVNQKNETISSDASQNNKAYDICSKRKLSADKAKKLGFLNYSDIPQRLKEWEDVGLDFIVKYYCDKYNINKDTAVKLFKGHDDYSAETIRNEVKKYNLTHGGIVSNSETGMGFTFKTKDGVKIASFEPDKNAIDSKQYFVQPSILKEVLEKFKVRDAIKLKILPEIEFVVIKFSKNMEKIEFDRSLTTLWLRNYKKLLKDNKSSLKLIVIFQGEVFVGATTCKMFSDSASIPSKRSDGNIKGRPIIQVNSFQVIKKLIVV